MALGLGLDNREFGEQLERVCSDLDRERVGNTEEVGRRQFATFLVGHDRRGGNPGAPSQMLDTPAQTLAEIPDSVPWIRG